MVRRSWAIALVACVLVAVLGLAGYRWVSVQQTGEVAVPPDAATPEEVVRAYVEAFDVHDCDTVVALVVPDLRRDYASACSDSWDHDELTVHDAFAENPRWSGHRPNEEVMNVPVKFGDEWWGYLLVRQSPRDPWRIFDEGVG